MSGFAMGTHRARAGSLRLPLEQQADHTVVRDAQATDSSLGVAFELNPAKRTAAREFVLVSSNQSHSPRSACLATRLSWSTTIAYVVSSSELEYTPA